MGGGGHSGADRDVDGQTMAGVCAAGRNRPLDHSADHLLPRQSSFHDVAPLYAGGQHGGILVEYHSLLRRSVAAVSAPYLRRSSLFSMEIRSFPVVGDAHCPHCRRYVKLYRLVPPVALPQALYQRRAFYVGVDQSVLYSADFLCGCERERAQSDPLLSIIVRSSPIRSTWQRIVSGIMPRGTSLPS